MKAIRYLLRADLRHRWRGLVGLALMIGVAGATVMSTIAAARRTDSAFARLLHTTNTWDLTVAPGTGVASHLTDAAVGRLAGVEQAASMRTVQIGRRHASTLAEFDTVGLSEVSDGVMGYTLGRPRVTEGRVPRRDRGHEVLVNKAFAALNHVGVGARLSLAASTGNRPNGPFDPHKTIPINLRVVGVGARPDEILTDDGFGTPQMTLSPAFERAYPGADHAYLLIAAKLRNGPHALSRFEHDVARLEPDESFGYQTTASTRSKVARSIRPQVGMLGAFAIVLTLTASFVVGQALSRRTALDAVDHPALRGLGMSRRQLFATTMTRAFIAACAGAVLAAALTALSSIVTPLGPGHAIEPNPGFAPDLTVLIVGAVILIGAVVVLAAWPAWRAARVRQSSALLHPSHTAGVLTHIGAPPALVSGVRMALEPGRGRTAVPVRTTIVASVLAMAMAIGALVFASSLNDLVDTPRLYGWNWDLQLRVSADTPVQQAEEHAKMDQILARHAAIVTVGRYSLTDATFATGLVPTVGIDPTRPALGPTVISGRLPRQADEVAIAQHTLKQLGSRVGRTVVVKDTTGADTTLHVVGTVVLPGLANFPAQDKTALGEGTVVTSPLLKRLGPDFGTEFFIVRFSHDASARDRHSLATKLLGVAPPGSEGLELKTAQKPADVIGYQRVRSTPFFVAGMLALLAAMTLAHSLVIGTRRRRRDFAILSTIGFTRRQVATSVAWQATTVGILALAFGVPLGIVLGRWAWITLAHDLGTVARVSVPWAVALAVPAVLLLVNVVAAIPARTATRIRPAVALRSE